MPCLQVVRRLRWRVDGAFFDCEYSIAVAASIAGNLHNLARHAQIKYSLSFRGNEISRYTQMCAIHHQNGNNTYY